MTAPPVGLSPSTRCYARRGRGEGPQPPRAGPSPLSLPAVAARNGVVPLDLEAEMTALVVYESMFGNTRLVAEAIARGLGPAETAVVAVGDVVPEMLQDAPLLVVSGPTHMHSLARPTSRKAAREQAGKPSSGLMLEPFVDAFGVREWLASLSRLDVEAAAFDTRLAGPGP